MKRIIFILLLCLLLTGCASLAPREYLSVTPHTGSGSQAGGDNAVTAENYLSLKNAILGFVKEGRTEGLIRITSYDGDVEEDLAAAAYEVSKQDPLGAYAVDYMTHECGRIVSFYEIRVSITFRRTAAEIAAVKSVPSLSKMQAEIEAALNSYVPGLILRVSSYRDIDIKAMVEHYCGANPEKVLEIPEVTTTVYPDAGPVRIVELGFRYSQDAKDLQRKGVAVEKSVNAAVEYIRYRETDRAKAELLFSYLNGRFSYQAGTSETPLYSALCGGVADPKGLSQAWQLICDRAGIPCRTVSGTRGADPYYWNIITADGVNSHVDLAECLLTEKALVLRSDSGMQGYYWDAKMYPVCPTQPPQPPAEEGPEEIGLPMEPLLPSEGREENEE